MSKVSFIILIFVSVKIIRLGKQLMIKSCVDNFNRNENQNYKTDF